MAEAISAAVVQLAEDHRLVLQLRYGEGLGFGAIGERMGRTADSARGVHRNALRQLRRQRK